MSRSEKQPLGLQYPGESVIRQWSYDLNSGIPSDIGNFIETIADSRIYVENGLYEISLPKPESDPEQYFYRYFDSFKEGIKNLVISEASLQHKNFILNEFERCIHYFNDIIRNKKNAWTLNTNSLHIKYMELNGYSISMEKFLKARKSICKEAISFIMRMKVDLNNLHPASFLKIPLSKLTDASAINPFFNLDIFFEKIEEKMVAYRQEFYSELANAQIIRDGKGTLDNAEEFTMNIQQGKYREQMFLFFNYEITSQFERAIFHIEEYLHFYSYSREAYQFISNNILKYNSKLMSSKGLDAEVFDLVSEKLYNFYCQLTTQYQDSNLIREECGFVRSVSLFNLSQKFPSAKVEAFIKSIYDAGLFDVPNKELLFPYFTGKPILRSIKWIHKADEYNYFFSKLSSILFPQPLTPWFEIERIFQHNSKSIRKCELTDSMRIKSISLPFTFLKSPQ